MKKEERNSEQAILAAAERVFMNKGFAAAKTTEIAAEAGVTHAMLHYYYGTKEKLFNRVYEEKITVMASSMWALIGSSGTTLVERIKLGLETHFDFLVQNPDLPRFIINEIVSNPVRLEQFKKSISTLAGNIISSLQRELDEAVARREIRAINAVDLMLDIVSLNVFMFVMLPIAREVAHPIYATDSELIEARKRENLQVILSRLQYEK